MASDEYYHRIRACAQLNIFGEASKIVSNLSYLLLKIIMGRRTDCREVVSGQSINNRQKINTEYFPMIAAGPSNLVPSNVRDEPCCYIYDHINEEKKIRR
jgi:hypothetical protein